MTNSARPIFIINKKDEKYIFEKPKHDGLKQRERLRRERWEKRNAELELDDECEETDAQFIARMKKRPQMWGRLAGKNEVTTTKGSWDVYKNGFFLKSEYFSTHKLKLEKITMLMKEIANLKNHYIESSHQPKYKNQ